MRPLSRVLKAPQQEQNPQVITIAHFAPLDVAVPPPAEAEEGEPEDRPEALEPAPAAEEPETQASAPLSGPDPEEEVEAARAEAQRLLDDARLQVAEFLRDAQQQARAIEADAREQGFQAGLDAARQAQRVLLADLDALRAEVQAEREQFFEGLESEVVRLSLAISEKIIRQEVDLHPEIVVGVARAAITQLKEARTVRISAHPAGADALRHHLSEGLPGGPGEISVQASPLVAPGGVIVGSDRGSVDARLETQMQRITAALEEGEG